MRMRTAKLLLAVVALAAAPQCGEMPATPTPAEQTSMSLVPRSEVRSYGSRVPTYVPPPDGSGGGVGGCYEISHMTSCTGTAPTCATCTTWLQCPSGIAVKEAPGYCPGDNGSCVFTDLCH